MEPDKRKARPAISEEDRDALYTTGWAAAAEAIQLDLANALQWLAVEGTPAGEKLSDDMVRQVFSLTFNTYLCMREFGPEPTGDIDLEHIMLLQQERPDADAA